MILGLQYNPTKYILNQNKYGKNGLYEARYNEILCKDNRQNKMEYISREKKNLVNNSPIFILLGFFQQILFVPESIDIKFMFEILLHDRFFLSML